MTTTPDDDWYWRQGIRPPGYKGLPPWVPKELSPPRPRPVPELGWCARCKRVNPRPGYPEDQDGHDWVEGLDRCAYVVGVICSDCVTTDERFEWLVEGHRLNGGIFINPADNPDDNPGDCDE